MQVDEVYEAGNWGLANKLKPRSPSRRSASISNTTTEGGAELRKVPHVLEPRRAAVVEEGDRRHFVVNPRATARDPLYCRQLHREALSDDGINAIYSWLVERDISAWNPHAPPMTDAKREIDGVSGNPQFDYGADLVESGACSKRSSGSSSSRRFKTGYKSRTSPPMRGIVVTG